MAARSRPRAGYGKQALPALSQTERQRRHKIFMQTWYKLMAQGVAKDKAYFKAYHKAYGKRRFEAKFGRAPRKGE
jgi:hypothetical protein